MHLLDKITICQGASPGAVPVTNLVSMAGQAPAAFSGVSLLATAGPDGSAEGLVVMSVDTATHLVINRFSTTC